MHSRTTRRSPARLCTALAFAASALAWPASPAASRAQRPVAQGDTRVLVPGRPSSGELAGGQAHVYRIAAGAGDFLVLDIAQHSVVPLVAVSDPAGRQIVATRGRNTSIVAGAGGRYRVEVRAEDKGAPPGRYEITVSPPRPASGRDVARAAGDARLGEGGLLVGQATAAAVRSGIEQLKSALALFRDAEHRPGEIAALLAIGQAYVRLGGQTRAAREHVDRALALARESGDRSSEAAALGALGSTYTALPDRRRAIELFEQALALYEATHDARGQSATHSNIGVALGDLREYEKGLEHHARSLALALDINDRAQAGTTYNNRGVIYLRSGDLPRALESLEHALPLTRATGSLRTQMMVVNNMGIAYKELGDYARSLDFYAQSLALARRLGNASAEAQVLNNTGNIYKALGENLKALEHYHQALPIYRRVQNRDGEAAVLNNIGSAHGQMGDLRRAMEFHEQSRELRKAIGDRGRESSSLTQAGVALHGLGELDKAAEYLREALAIRRRLGEPLAEAETLLHIAAVERDRGNLGESRETIATALGITESMRARISDAGLRASYVARVQETYELYVDVLMRQHAEAPSAGHDAEALQAAERTRARVLLESLVEARSDIRQGVDASLLDREQSLLEELDDASERLSRALGGRPAGMEAARKELDRLTAEYRQVQAQIRDSSPRYAALTQPEPLSAARIQREVLDEETVLLEFALGKTRSWLWAVTSQTVASIALPPRREIEAAARSWYLDVIARQPRARESAAAYSARVSAADRRIRAKAAGMSRMLLGGVAGQLHGPWRGKRLVIVAAGALEYLPFAALPIPPAGEGPDALPSTAASLIARHEIVEAPSASVLATLRREAANRQPARHAVAVVADPVFDRDDPRVAPLSRRRADRPAASRGTAANSPATGSSYLTTRAVQALADTRGSAALARLPFSRDEARAITALAGSDGTLSATDFRASRAAVLGEALADYRIVHFATHGLIDTERPELSGLILSLVNDRGLPQDGLLRLHDIFNMRLNADLVVLSACQTALGKEIRGEGLVGLTRGFMYAGAPRVVASLWQVSDLATAQLMRRFYAGMLRRGLSPAAALRAAQLEMAADRRWASPYYWAGFVLQGDWK